MSYPESICLENICNVEEFLSLVELDNFEPSKVYETNSKTNLIVPTVRSSSRRQYTDNTLFDWVEKNLIAKLNEAYTDARFSLVRNDLDVIHYRPGDYFKAHQDHVNVKSNMFENYTFIMCLKGCKEGGETILYDLEKHPTLYTCTGQSPGSALVFLKTTLHEGAPVLKGEKLILMGNLLAFPTATVDFLSIRGFLFPVDKLPKKSEYAAFYHLQKQCNPEKHVFTYNSVDVTDSDLARLWNFYACSQDLENSNIRLERSGLARGTLNTRVDKFLSGTEKILLCTMNEYYGCLDALPENIVPVHVITINPRDMEYVIWAGFGNNLFMCCDYRFSENALKDDESASEYDIVIKKPFKYSVDDIISRKESCGSDAWFMEVKDDYISKSALTEIRKATFKSAALQPLSSVMPKIGGQGAEQILNVVKEVALWFGNDPCKEVQDIIEKISAHDANPYWKTLDPNQLINLVMEQKMATKVVTVGESYYCNESEYEDYDITVKFALIRDPPVLVETENSESEEESEAKESLKEESE